MKDEHLSNSRVQLDVEKNIINTLKNKYNCEFTKKIDGLNCEPDFFNEEKKIIGEIYTSSDLKGSRKNKLTADCFKLVTVEKKLGGTWNKYILVKENVKREFEKGWRNEAIKLFGIELKVIEISEEDIQALQEARRKQKQGMKISKTK